MEDTETVHGLEVYDRYLEALGRIVSGQQEDMDRLAEAGIAIHRLGYEDYFAGRRQLPSIFIGNRNVRSLWDGGYQAAVTAAELMLCKCDCDRYGPGSTGLRICARRERLGAIAGRQQACRLSCRGA